MMWAFLLWSFLLAAPLAQLAPAQTPAAKPIWDATHFVYAWRDDDPLRGPHWDAICSATAFKYEAGVTWFVTAAHCLEGTAYGISAETSATEPASMQVEAVSVEDDVALLSSVVLSNTVPLGNDPMVGDEVFAVVAPYMWRKLLVNGIVSALADEKTIRKLMVQLVPIIDGLSGSAVYCKEQRVVCGVITGGLRQIELFALAQPVSTVKKLVPREKAIE